MNPRPIEVRGTVRPDGVLELDGPVALAPGRVLVTVRPVRPEEQPELPRGDPFWEMMRSIWDGQKARGHVPRTAEEIDAEVRESRDGWDERQRQIEQLQEDSRRSREQAE